MRYYIPCAKNKFTGRRVQQQKLGGKKKYSQYNEAYQEAVALSDKMNTRTQGWYPSVKESNYRK
jgi:hypothetical protein